MKRFLLFILIIIGILLPIKEVKAIEYVLSSGAVVTGTYAGEKEEDYNDIKVAITQDGFMKLNLITSDNLPLEFDILDCNKQIIASNIQIENGQPVFQRVKKDNIYYIRTKGKKNTTFAISYSIVDIDTISQTNAASYTITNASLKGIENALLLKIRPNKTGIFNLIFNTNNKMFVQYLNSKRKAISYEQIVEKNNLTGIGVKKNTVYFVKLWTVKDDLSGTTTIQEMKYQIKKLGIAKNTSRIRAIKLGKKKNRSKEALVLADKKNVFWFKVPLKKRKKLSFTVESRLLQNTGGLVTVDIYSSFGKKINKTPIVIEEEAKAEYNGIKYEMIYPEKTITTKKLKKGNYYIRISSKSKLTSGSIRITLN